MQYFQLVFLMKFCAVVVFSFFILYCFKSSFKSSLMKVQAKMFNWKGRQQLHISLVRNVTVVSLYVRTCMPVLVETWPSENWNS